MNVCMCVCRSNGRFSMSELSAVIEDEIKDVFKQYKPGDISGPTNLAGAVHTYMHTYIQFFIYTYIKRIRYSSLSNVESVSSCICRRYSNFFLYEMIDIFWSDYVYVCMYVCFYFSPFALGRATFSAASGLIMGAQVVICFCYAIKQCMYVCMYVFLLDIYRLFPFCISVKKNLSLYVCGVYVCMYCMYVCIYLFMYVWIHRLFLKRLTRWWVTTRCPQSQSKTLQMIE